MPRDAPLSQVVQLELEQLLQRADAALYRAKQQGRNRLLSCVDGAAEAG
ncbi:MAG: diguanylate cyclase [Gammaproteobacteria bacterium]|nr:diguanylate cyclase [Gammaproteobacteria bacterium]